MSDTPRQLPRKRDVTLHVLDQGDAFVHLDPRRSGVVVPAMMAAQPQLVLQIGRNMAVRIPDLEVEHGGIGATLVFNRVSFRCELPWSSIYAVIGADGKGMVWPDDVPPEAREQMDSQSAELGRAPARLGSSGSRAPNELHDWSLSAAEVLHRRGARKSAEITVEADGAPVTIALRRERFSHVLVISVGADIASEAGAGATPYRGRRERPRGVSAIVVRRRTRFRSLLERLSLASSFSTPDEIFDQCVSIESEASSKRVSGVLSRDETRVALLQILDLGFEAVGFAHHEGSLAAIRMRPALEHLEVERLWAVCSLLCVLDRHARDSGA